MLQLTVGSSGTHPLTAIPSPGPGKPCLLRHTAHRCPSLSVDWPVFSLACKLLEGGNGAMVVSVSPVGDREPWCLVYIR